ncbi:hypothetical protein AB0M79_09670 [Polymorphospora sp. NPDC051019]|uniref:hypothetical protein n=1 Tax=Polymorphospora sp. NPDC051019 TaxID=3155725 RepID=UPI00342B9305
MNLRRHPLFRLLLRLDLPTTDYVVFGSGPLLAYGLRDGIGDLDIVARNRAWNICCTVQPPRPAPSGLGQMIRLHQGALEVVNQWLSPEFETDRLIADSRLVDGIPFASLRDVVASKWLTNRPKDHVDLARIAATHSSLFSLVGGSR